MQHNRMFILVSLKLKEYRNKKYGLFRTMEWKGEVEYKK